MPDIFGEILRIFSISHVLQVLSILSSVHTVVGLAICASLIVILEDWRWSLLLLLAQYILAGLLLSSTVLPRLAVIKILVGAIATLTLYWTARFTTLTPSTRAELAAQGAVLKPPAASTMGRPLRSLTVVLGALVISALQVRFPIPVASVYVSAGAYWLLGMGLVIMMLTQEPFKIGLGLLLFQSGFDLFYTALEPGLVVIGLSGLVTLLTALLIAYLTSAEMIPWLEKQGLDLRSAAALDEAIRVLVSKQAVGKKDEPA